MSGKKPTDIIKTNSEIEEEGEGGKTQIEESYRTILARLGEDVRGLSIEEIKEMIHRYKQDGGKGAKLIDFKTGKSKQSYKKEEKKERYYQVKDRQDAPMSPEEAKRQLKEEDYKSSSDKQETPTVDQPFSPKPRP